MMLGEKIGQFDKTVTIRIEIYYHFGSDEITITDDNMDLWVDIKYLDMVEYMKKIKKSRDEELREI